MKGSKEKESKPSKKKTFLKVDEKALPHSPGKHDVAFEDFPAHSWKVKTKYPSYI